MSVNSSNITHTSLYHCSDSRVGFLISIGFIITKALFLLPLSTFILYLGYQRWRQQHSFTTTSHSDIFTYHMTAVELAYILGATLYFCGIHAGLSEMMIVGFYVANVGFPGQMGFHILTCVERYLAVVHPVTYMGLKQSGGVRIRNISSVCVWLLCLAYGSILTLSAPHLPVGLILCLLVVSLIVVSFCSLRVLCVLIRPGPGEVGGDRERVDQSKQRAFHTIMAITGVLCLWFAGFVVCAALESSDLLSYDDRCLVLMSGIWFSLPSSLVLPVLFLHRPGKLFCCCYGRK